VQSFRFLLGMETIEGTYIEKRIDDVLGSKGAGFVYKPRSGGINLNSNQRYYTPEMRNYVLKMCKEYINFFGYTKLEGVDNQFGFFEYENLKEEEIKNAGAYDALNKEMLAWYIAEREVIDQNSVEINKEGTGIQIKFNDEPMVKFQKIRGLCHIKGDLKEEVVSPAGKSEAL